MREVFRFWGYGPEVFASSVGEDRFLQVMPQTGVEPVFGRVSLARDLLARCGPHEAACRDGWWSWLLLDPREAPAGEAAAWVTLSSGKRRSLVTRTGASAYAFHFAVDHSLAFLQNERFLPHAPPLYLRLGLNLQRLPAWARTLGFDALHLIRRARRGRGVLFPTAPGDPCVNVWRRLIRAMVEEGCGASPMPFWPDGKRYAVTLTHDVDSDHGFRSPAAIETLRRIEEAENMRSAWLVVTKHLAVGRAVLDDLYQAGHEVGFHGTHHDHRLAFLPAGRMHGRIAEAADLLGPYGASGVRSPNYLRTPALYRALDGVFAYDMSMHDVVSSASGLTRRNEGCCTCMPFVIDGTDLLEIPTTVPEDWEFDLLGVAPSDALRIQLAAIERIKTIGGVANILTHPEPSLSLQPRWLEMYRQVVRRVASDSDAWVARPECINRYWRERLARIDVLWAGGTERKPESRHVEEAAVLAAC